MVAQWFHLRVATGGWKKLVFTASLWSLLLFCATFFALPGALYSAVKSIPGVLGKSHVVQWFEDYHLMTKPLSTY
eukprot:3774979-Amphidinium_carterae.1